MSELRYCYSCHQKLDVSEFTKRANSHDGLDFYCRQCKSDKNSQYYYKQSKEYIELQKEKRKEYQKKYIRKRNNKYYKIYQKIRKDKFYTYIYNIKSNGCCVCGEKEKCCLDFHHLNPKTKQYDISDMSIKGFDKIKLELQKCVCVCKNCHRKIHSGIIESPPESLLIQPD